MLNENLLIHLTKEDAENQVLGVLLVYPEQIEEAFVKPEYFYGNTNQVIFESMQEIHKKGYKVDVPTVLDYVTKRGNIDPGDAFVKLKDLAGQAFTTINLVHHQNKVLESYKKREQAKIFQGALNNLLDDEVDDTNQKVISSLTYLGSLNATDEDDGHISKVMTKIYENLQNPSNYLYSKSHYRDFDKLTNGFKRKDLVILGARPSMGKTAFAMDIAKNHALENNAPSVIFSIEMPKEGLGTRMISSDGNIDGDKFKDAQERLNTDDWRKLTVSMGRLSKSKMHMFDESTIDVEGIKRKVRMIKAMYGEEHMLVIIDYLQLIKGSKVHQGNRTQEISEISRELKLLAKEMDVTVIALSQLSRNVEQRQDKRPMNSDLRESGSIEQDADVIILLYRDDYYDKYSESKNIIEIIIAKNRDGSIGTVNLGFKKEFSKFVNIDWGAA